MSAQLPPQKPGESDTAYAMRCSYWYKSVMEPDEAEAWQAHRAQVDNRTGSGTGLYGNATPTERAQALNSHGFGGDQTLNYTGGQAVTAVPGSVVVQRVWASQISEDAEPGVSPLTAHLRSSGTGWH